MLVATALLIAHMLPAFAEKSDREQKLDYEADRQSKLDRTGDIESLLLEGGVVISQGTMRINATKLVLRQDKDGKRFGEAFGAPVFFKQKQDGKAEFLEAVSDRLEFDERTNTVKLFNKAKLKLGKDELAAEYIVYNTVTERYEATGTAPGAKLPTSTGRVKGTLYPKLKAPDASESVPTKPN